MGSCRSNSHGKKTDIPQEKQKEIKSWESSGPNLGFKPSHGADSAGICLGKFPLDSDQIGCGGKGGQRGKSIGKQSFPPKKLLPKGFHEFEDEAGDGISHSTLSSPPATSLDFPGNHPEAGEGFWPDLPLDE